MKLAPALLVLALSSAALAHVTPPVVLTSDRDAVRSLLDGSNRWFVREVRLTAAQKEEVRRACGWTPDEDYFRFYLGRAGSSDIGAVVFMTETTIHGPVRVAVALAPGGTVKSVKVTEVTEETWPWVKRIVDDGYLRSLQGRSAHAAFPPAPGGASSMAHFYGQIIAGLVQRAALVYDAAMH
jgi:hypothetical protein